MKGFFGEIQRAQTAFVRGPHLFHSKGSFWLAFTSSGSPHVPRLSQRPFVHSSLAHRFCGLPLEQGLLDGLVSLECPNGAQFSDTLLTFAFGQLFLCPCWMFLKGSHKHEHLLEVIYLGVSFV